MKQQTLLAHLALQKKFSDKYENIAVEALGHILSTSPAAVRALEDVLQTGGAAIGEIARVETQASGEEGTRPDLAGRDTEGVERVLIEAKFGAGLTENQPVTYLERLPENQSSVLLFVAPAERLESLWTELCRLVAEAEIVLSSGPLRSATTSGKRRLMLISWTDLLDRMAPRASTSRESHTESDIHQLRGLAEQMDKEVFLPLRPEELGPEFPCRLRSLEQLVDNVIERLEQKELAAKVKGGASRSNTAYGERLQLSGAGAWFGIDHWKWAEVRDTTPLWLHFNAAWHSVQPFSEIRECLQPLGPELFEDGDDVLVVPIYPPVSVEYDAVLNAVVARIKEVAELINPAD